MHQSLDLKQKEKWALTLLQTYFFHSLSPEVDCCPGLGGIVNCAEVGSSFLATTGTFTPDLDKNWERFWQSSKNVQTNKNCFNSLFSWKTKPDSQFCACFSFSCKASVGWRENSFYSFSFVAAAKPLFLFPAWLRQILLGSWTWMH